jgi:hypothetical protein
VVELAFQVKPTVCDVGDAPTPASDTVAGEFVALLPIITLPFTGPFTVGANVIVSTALWLGARVKPELTPLGVNAAPATVTLEMVTFEFPMFVNVVASELLLLKFTTPNGKIIGLALNSMVTGTPVPFDGIVSGEPGASFTSETDPLTNPTVVGAKTMLNVVLPPAAIVLGNDRPFVLNPAPITLTCEIVKLALPLFVSVIGWVLLFPVITLPKLAMEGFATSWA